MIPEATIWSDGGRAESCYRLAGLMGGRVRLIGVGGPSAGALDRLADEQRCARYDDMRKMLCDHPSAFVFVASSEGMRAEDVRCAVSQDSVVLAVEPPYCSMDELAECYSSSRGMATGQESGGRIIHVPAMIQSPGWLRAAEPAEAIGPLRSVRLTNVGPAQEGSLAARLFDAFFSLLRWFELPESIDASLGRPSGDDRLQESKAELMRASGYLQALVRFSEGRGAVLQVSDRGGSHGRSLDAIGERGSCWMGDLDYTLRDGYGRVLDKHMTGTGDRAIDGVELIARQWKLLLDQHPGVPMGYTQSGAAKAMACCMATMLSCRTGQPESPGTWHELRGAGKGRFQAGLALP